MKIKTQDLTGPALDWAVAKCEYPEQSINTALGFPYLVFGRFNPSTDWSQGGPIIEREKFDVVYQAGGRGDEWACFANDIDDNLNSIDAGPTPLIAAMRCYVASKLGDEVDIPEELL
jgi:hypothetical protein